MATIKQMHIMRIKAEAAKHQLKGKKKLTPLAKEIETRRDEIIRGIIGNSVNLVNKQLEVASLPVTPNGKDNDTVLKASNALLDRAFGKAKESIDFTGNVQFSLKDLAQQRLTVANEEVIPLEDMID
jgi:hypothetical protein